MLDAISGLINTVWGNINAGRNLELQGQQLDYQKAMQQNAWAREDNAVQRRVADLKAAGLSPVLAAGSAAQSSGPIQVTTPQRDYVPTDVNILGEMQQMNQVRQTEAQARLTEAAATEKEFSNEYFMKKIGIPVEGMDIWGKRIGELLNTLSGNNPTLKIKDWSSPEVSEEKKRNPIQDTIKTPDRLKRSGDLEN